VSSVKGASHLYLMGSFRTDPLTFLFKIPTMKSKFRTLSPRGTARKRYDGGFSRGETFGRTGEGEPP
jgi:hypothetical protein